MMATGKSLRFQSFSQAPADFVHLEKCFEVLRNWKGRYQVHFEGSFYNFDKVTKRKIRMALSQKGL
jgi:hypothetical protein